MASAANGILVRPLLSVAFILGLCTTALAQLPGPKDTFANSGLSAKEARDITAAVEASAYDTPDSWTDELRLKKAVIGDTPGLIVRGTKLLCGATVNCQTWVFRQASGRWLSLFRTEEPPVVDNISFGPSAAHGIKDLTVSVNLGAESEQKTTYSFDGQEYRRK